MSRLGKQPIDLPAGVTVTVGGDKVTVKGKLGTLERRLPAGITLTQEGQRIHVHRAGDEAQAKAMHGLSRSLLQGMVTGVAQGYEKQLEIVGVSYQASATPQALSLKIGYANDVVIPIPKGVTVQIPNPTLILVKGADKHDVGQFAAKVRLLRPPEPYKGKGIRYRGEYVQRKQGKSFVGSE